MAKALSGIPHKAPHPAPQNREIAVSGHSKDRRGTAATFHRSAGTEEILLSAPNPTFPALRKIVFFRDIFTKRQRDLEQFSPNRPFLELLAGGASIPHNHDMNTV
ncbi:hypothetical protein QWZ10_00575 [Paracoccus cavernae]|uniref:Uncharacterized protein n=1 Tax=Paracoccus cavernae TaxID=1571207 RepID=A0ABT8D2J3_9RHOB|nr:hypothetical protein [Paracoccus cavernae]